MDLSRLDLLFIDTETGGLSPGKHSLLEVGMIAYKNGEVKDEINFVIKEEEYCVTANALRFNGIDLYNIYRQGFEPEMAVKIVKRFISDNFSGKKPVQVGHNIGFDKAMMTALFSRFSEKWDDYASYRTLDTMSLLHGLYLAGKVPEKTLSSSGAFEYFGIKIEKRHRALDDIKGTVTLLEKLIALI